MTLVTGLATLVTLMAFVTFLVPVSPFAATRLELMTK